jgi:replicative DNA helicase
MDVTREPTGGVITDAELEHWATPTFEEHVENVGVVQVEEARAMLSLDVDTLPRWFSRQLHTILGPIPPLDITVVAARPGCGKTTLMLAQARHMVLQGHRIIFVGTEMPGWRLRVQVAAQECQLSTKLVIQNRWAELPVGSKERILKRVEAFDKETAGRWFFTPEDSIDHNRLLEYVQQAGESKATLFVDHLHNIDWGARAGDATGAMSTGIHRLKDVAKEHDVRLFLAAQLRRTGTYDVLADYMVPDQSGIKQSGSVEEVAHTVVLLHRALKAGATDIDLALVRRGQKRMEDVVEHGTSVATVGKDRLGGSARDAEARLYVENGEMFDSPEARQTTYGSMAWTQK